jgi:hypothetical protein
MPADLSLTVLLVAFVLDLFILQPIEVLSGWAKYFVDTLVLAGIILSILSVVGVRLASVLFVAFSTTAIGLRAFRIAAPEIGVGYLQSFVALVAFAILAWLVLGLVLRSGRVTIHRIQGAVVVYLLLAMMWVQAYRLIALYDPGAFVVMDEVQRVDADVTSKLTFFSFSVITAASFIDLTPVNPVARSLAMLESLTGQLYLVILIARLVSLEVEARHEKKGRQAGETERSGGQAL